jgi:TonB family protein
MNVLASLSNAASTTPAATWLFGYLLNSLWQLPLAFAAAWLAARIARPAGPQAEHRIWVGALVLEIALPACPWQLDELGGHARTLLAWFGQPGVAGGQTHVVLGPGIVARVAWPALTGSVLVALTAAYLCLILYFAVRLLWGLAKTQSLRRAATPLAPGRTAIETIRHLRALSGIGPVRFASSPQISGPATVGLRRPTLLLPPAFLDHLGPHELEALLGHEFAHIRRADFAKNLLYGVLSLPAAWHPLLWLTRARLAETRELVCDELAAQAAGGPQTYARSLLQLASILSTRTATRPAPQILHAIGIFDANIFERRVMQLTRTPHRSTGLRRLIGSAACTLLALATCGSALALRMDVNQAPVKDAHPAHLNVKPGSMTLVNKSVPVYPVDAKKARVSGTVTLAAIIGKDGAVQNLRVVSGPTLLQQSALDAVRQWRYQPYKLNGDPVEVSTSVKVTYTLAK